MDKIILLMKTLGPLGAAGVGLIVIGTGALSGVDVLDISKYRFSTMAPSALIGLTCLLFGLGALVWRVVTDKSDGALCAHDKHLLGAEILGSLNRQAVLGLVAEREDLRRQLAGLTNARASLQRLQHSLTSHALREMVDVVIDVLIKINRFNPWRDELQVPSGQEQHTDIEYFDKWCEEQKLKGRPVPQHPNGYDSYYYSYLWVIQDELELVRTILPRLQRLKDRRDA